MIEQYNMMEHYIASFGKQLTEALKSSKIKPIKELRPIHNIIISGMGGSGIGGMFVQEYLYDKINIPIIINKSYKLPSFINENAVVITSSYSGNTEETLRCFYQALEKKSFIIGITSGGKLENLCKQHQCPVIILPKGYPPRTCLGYSLIALLNIFSQLNIIKDDWIEEINESIHLLAQEQINIRHIARTTALQIHQTFPIIYSLHSEALALRLRQQLNENSKVLCSHHIIPEMNHNEIVGWKNLYVKHTVIGILTKFDSDENKKRYEFCKKVFANNHAEIIDLMAKGNSMLAQYLYIVHLSDWVSYELAILNKEDPIEVKVIEQLKSELSK